MGGGCHRSFLLRQPRAAACSTFTPLLCVARSAPTSDPTSTVCLDLQLENAIGANHSEVKSTSLPAGLRMPRYHSTPNSPIAAMHNHYTPVTTSRTSTSRQPVPNSRTQGDAPAAYRPHMLTPTTRHNPNQPAMQSHQQQWQQPHPILHQQPRAQPRLPPSRHIHNAAAVHAPSTQHKTPESIVTKLLPYCTIERPLDESQIISLTDAAGSLQGLVLLALGAKDGDEACLNVFLDALGSDQAVSGVLDFFCDEFEVE